MRMGNKRPGTSVEKFRKRTQALKKAILRKVLETLTQRWVASQQNSYAPNLFNFTRLLFIRFIRTVNFQPCLRCQGCQLWGGGLATKSENPSSQCVSCAVSGLSAELSSVQLLGVTSWCATNPHRPLLGDLVGNFSGQPCFSTALLTILLL